MERMTRVFSSVMALRGERGTGAVSPTGTAMRQDPQSPPHRIPRWMAPGHVPVPQREQSSAGGPGTMPGPSPTTPKTSHAKQPPKRIGWCKINRAFFFFAPFFFLRNDLICWKHKMVRGIYFTIKYEIKEFYLLNPALQIERSPVQFLHNVGYKFNSHGLRLPAADSALRQRWDPAWPRRDPWHTCPVPAPSHRCCPSGCRAPLPTLLPLIFLFYLFFLFFFPSTSPMANGAIRRQVPPWVLVQGARDSC